MQQLDPYEVIKNQAKKIEQLSSTIAEADVKIRTALSWAVQFPGGPKELVWSVDGLIEEYRKVKG